MDIEIEEKVGLKEFKDKLNNNLPDGIKIISCKYIEEKTASLMSLVNDASYVVKCHTTEDYAKGDLENLINDFLNKEEILYKKRNNKTKKVKTINIRPMIKSMYILTVDKSEIIIKMNLSTGSRGNLKPEVVIEKLSEEESIKFDINKTRYHRLELFKYCDNGDVAPIESIE